MLYLVYVVDILCVFWSAAVVIGKAETGGN